MQPFIGQIMTVGFNFAPRGWAKCDGQLLSISQNEALFSLLGTTYGGDGRTNFALPDLRGRVAIGEGQGNGLSNHNLGQRGGVENVTLTQAEIPNQTYSADLSNLKGKIAFSTDNGDTSTPSTDNVFAVGIVTKGRNSLGDAKIYKNASISDQTKDIDVSGTVTINNGGGSKGHSNIQPFLALNYVIALTGIFPSRN